MADIPLIAISTPAQTSPADTKNDPARIRDAACQFESLLIAQMMKSMHDPDHGWMSDGDDDQAGGIATQFAEEQFAQSLAHQGGLGLSRLVVSGLESSAVPGAPRPAAGAAPGPGSSR